MSEKVNNLQDAFLNHVRRNKIPITVFLINGVKLQGIINFFDNFCILLRRDSNVQLVYKHAVSTIMPGEEISLFVEDEDTEEQILGVSFQEEKINEITENIVKQLPTLIGKKIDIFSSKVNQDLNGI